MRLYAFVCVCACERARARLCDPGVACARLPCLSVCLCVSVCVCGESVRACARMFDTDVMRDCPLRRLAIRTRLLPKRLLQQRLLHERLLQLMPAALQQQISAVIRQQRAVRRTMMSVGSSRRRPSFSMRWCATHTRTHARTNALTRAHVVAPRVPRRGDLLSALPLSLALSLFLSRTQVRLEYLDLATFSQVSLYVLSVDPVSLEIRTPAAVRVGGGVGEEEGCDEEEEEAEEEQLAVEDHNGHARTHARVSPVSASDLALLVNAFSKVPGAEWLDTPAGPGERLSEVCMGKWRGWLPRSAWENI